jgi:NADH:ubiquinone oxidoreductase subunit F (NADH-binding)
VSARRLLAGVRGDAPLSLAGHEAVHGPAPAPGPGLIEAAQLAGLRGRGGAGFPTAVKLRGVASQRGPRSVLVNGAEGEPLSGKDRVLMRLAPHLVLDGAMAAAAAVGAREVVVAVRADGAGAVESLRRALAERAGDPASTIVTVPVAYLAGEESALIRHLDGGPLKPVVVPPLPFERGLRRRPTLVQNPETLAHLALIARHGPEWFRGLGTPAHSGTALVTVAGEVARPGVQEVACGTPLDAVIAAAGGATQALRAVLIGGYHGTWIPARAIGAVTLDDEGLSAYGATLAAGVVVALGESACPVQELAQTMWWLAEQSARQCGPCSHGLPALAAMLAAIASGTAPPDAGDRLVLWGKQVTGRGACRLPDGAVRFLASGLRVFAAELDEHARRGPCRACPKPTVLAAPAGRRVAA